ncbi:MAG: beta-galactosidase GalB [Chitinophagaceae bacterium]
MNRALLIVMASLASVRFVAGQMVAVRDSEDLRTGWYFMRYDQGGDSLIYDVRPEVRDRNDSKVADTRADISEKATQKQFVLKPWILPTGNPFLRDPQQRHLRPAANPGIDFPFTQASFDDSGWEKVSLPHDWAIGKPFYKGEDVPVGGGMGRLPLQGIAWYRKKIAIPSSDHGKSIYLDIDGAMSYAMVWLNGYLVGGWPYGYNSFRLDLTPYIQYGKENQLAIRLDNPSNSARWYPGGGLYRNVRLVKTNAVHISQWGTFVTTQNVTAASAGWKMSVALENNGARSQAVSVQTSIYYVGNGEKEQWKKVKVLPVTKIRLVGHTSEILQLATDIPHPALWQPLPHAVTNRYAALTYIVQDGKVLDSYTTYFGIRKLRFDSLKGLLVNDLPVRIQGVNQHSDLGALGMAFNYGAARRQLELLKQMGCNAIRMSHNPPDPGLLKLTDEMGFLVIDEVFDCWEKGKTPLDFHLIFPEWHEADLRAMIRRDRNHPSIIEWSFGNEVGEQYTDTAGARIAHELRTIVHEEDTTRPATASMNYAKPYMPFPKEMDVLSVNYQGEGIRDASAYAALKGIHTPPLYGAFQKAFPSKMIQSSESASTLSSRGTYMFPVFEGTSAPISDDMGGDSLHRFVSSYDLYTAAFGASPDKVFAAQDRHPYIAGEFVWTGFDYLGEPTPYYSSRSSYSGIIDLAGFPKDRFYLYQSRWRPDLPMAHILPHWTWPERVGKITPVHVYSSGDEAELFLNGKSLGRKKRGQYEYRFRWDSVVYEPGVLQVVAYKKGKHWAEEKVHTAGNAVSITLQADKKRAVPSADERVFVTVQLKDKDGITVPNADEMLRFDISGPGKIIATDNGDPSDLQGFSLPERKTLGGYALVIIQPEQGRRGTIVLSAHGVNGISGKTVISVL